jgi:DNA-binding ferritin-like protein
MDAVLHGDSADSAEMLTGLLGRLKALYWFHWTAHWQTAGASFYGDHLMFERMKDSTAEEIDQLAEKIVGLFGAGAVNPHHVLEHEQMSMPTEGTGFDLAGKAFDLESQFQAELKNCYDHLEMADLLPLGLDDFLQALASAHDTNIYLLQQRLGGKQASVEDQMKGLLPRAAYFNSLERGWMGQSSFRPNRHAENEDEHGAYDEWLAAGLLTEENRDG